MNEYTYLCTYRGMHISIQASHTNLHLPTTHNRRAIPARTNLCAALPGENLPRNERGHRRALRLLRLPKPDPALGAAGTPGPNHNHNHHPAVQGTRGGELRAAGPAAGQRPAPVHIPAVRAAGRL